MKIACLQIRVGKSSKAARVERVRRMLCGIRADFAVLPELWNVGYFNFESYRKDAEPLGGRTCGMLSEAARRGRMHVCGGSFVEKSGGRLYNCSPWFGPDGRLAGVYRKIHLFGFKSREKKMLAPGRAVGVFRTAFGKVGTAICYDLRFPEQFRLMAARGAQVFAVAAAWPHPRLEAWRMFCRVRASENQAFLVAANACGSPQCGHSMIVAPSGDVLVQAGEGETVLGSDVDIGQVAALRREFPALSDRVALR